MKVLLNDNGFITSFAMIGDLIGGIDIPDPEDTSDFFEHFTSYKVVDGLAVFDDTMDKTIQLETTILEYRMRREKECFPVINRGTMWYELLTEEQENELRVWYKQWLDVTDTMIVPERPSWLK